MTQFSSKPPFNDDPEPWNGVGAEDIWDPRPEYNRPQHNPTNPILTEFRKLHAETGNDLWTDAYLSWSDLIEEDWGTKDEYWHAFSVLGKIVSLGKVNG